MERLRTPRQSQNYDEIFGQAFERERIPALVLLILLVLSAPRDKFWMVGQTTSCRKSVLKYSQPGYKHRRS